MTETLTMWDGTTKTRPVEAAAAFTARVFELTGACLSEMPDLPADAHLVPGPVVARRSGTVVYAITDYPIGDGEPEVLGYVVSGRTDDLPAKREPAGSSRGSGGVARPAPAGWVSLQHAVSRHPDGRHMCRALSAIVAEADRDCYEACEPSAHPDLMASAERSAAAAAMTVARDSGRLRARRQHRAWGVSA